jgi:hypothetical protein
MSYYLCVRCGCAGSTAFVTFRQNVSYFFRRDLEALRREVAEMSGPKGESFRQWIMWSKVSVAEKEILAHEWGKCERGASAT